MVVVPDPDVEQIKRISQRLRECSNSLHLRNTVDIHTKRGLESVLRSESDMLRWAIERLEVKLALKDKEA